MDFGTNSGTDPDDSGEAWMKIFLEEDKGYCLTEITWYSQSIDQILTSWTCNENDCNCEGDSATCNNFNLAVETSSETTQNNLPSLPCKYGDTVKLESTTGAAFSIDEIVLIGKQG